MSPRRFVSPATRVARQVLYEDKHLLVLNKWAGQLSQGSAKADSKSNNLLADAASYLGDSKKFVGLVHRLDRPVSGVFILAKTSAAAKALSEDLRERKIQKHYIALVNGVIPARTENKKLGSLVTKDPLNNKTHVIPTADLHANEVKRIRGLPHVQHAELSYSHVAAHVNDRKQAQSVVHVQLLTGRKHQIRAQLSSVGHHIVGDGKYGAPQRFKLERDIALHAYAAVFSHPIERSKRVVITAALPHSWARFMGGEKESAALMQTLETTLKVKLGDGDV